MAKIVFAILSTVGGKLQEELVSKLVAISAYSKENEPGVPIYAVCASQDPSDAKTVYMIEVYEDEAAFDAHMSCALVKDMIQWMGDNPALTGAPAITTAQVVQDFGLLARVDALDQTAAPYVVVGDLAYQSSEHVDRSLPFWATVVESTKTSETGSLVYAVARNVDDAAKLLTLEAYESQAYLWDVHANSAAVQANVQGTKAWRTGLTLHKLKKVDGYLAKI